VVEYLEGETLADRLEKGPLPTSQVLKIGIEIADALDKATPPRHHPPRLEAGQHHADQVWRQAHGLRSRQAGALSTEAEPWFIH